MTPEQLAELIESVLKPMLGNHLIKSEVFRVGTQVYVGDLYIEVQEREA